MLYHLAVLNFSFDVTNAPEIFHKTFVEVFEDIHVYKSLYRCPYHIWYIYVKIKQKHDFILKEVGIAKSSKEGKYGLINLR